MLDSFISYLLYEKGRSPLTAERYEQALRSFQQFFQELDSSIQWSNADQDVIRRWVETLMDKGNSPASINTDLAALRTFFRFALQKGWVEKDPTKKIGNAKTKKRLPNFVKENEMDDVLADPTLIEADNKNVHARTIIILLYETGLRRAELASLNVADIDLAARQLKVTGKGGKQRIVPFGEEAEKVLRQLISEKTDKDGRQPLLTGKNGRRITGGQIYYYVRKHLTGFTKAEKRSPHVLRHSYATALLNNGAKIENVRQLLGHSSAQTTMIYTHATTEQLMRIYRQTHPRGKGEQQNDK